ncbi:MAG: protease modulator HflC [Candidatus Omnitrophica bacterium]|nr:protease modulator HflC [Candidatus Omnitrophota bacterium]
MKKIITILAGVIITVAVLFVVGALYIVSETQQAVLTQFGKPVGNPITEAGIHIKIPLVQKVQLFDKRLMKWDGDPNQIPTVDKKYIWVDTTARWKIIDALKFLQSVGTERGAQARLDDIINSATRDAVTSSLLIEVTRNTNRVLEQEELEITSAFAEEALEAIRYGRAKLEDSILERARKLAPRYGIELVDVRIKRINYVEDVRKKVYERMISERKRAAEEFRSEGRGKSAEIEGTIEKELKLISSVAYKTAEEIRGEADAATIKIYAEAYKNDPDFYSFIKTLETYRDTIGGETTLMLTTDSDYFKYLKKIS